MADTTGIKQTPNIGLYQPDYANIADIQVLDENFEILDKANTHDLTLYVDAGAPEAGDGSQEKPFQTVQEAIDRGHLGKGVVYIEIAEGNYPERITTPRAPHITWRLTGTGAVTLQGALFDDCNYAVLSNLTFTMPTGTVANDVIQIANCNNCAVIDCTINGQASMTALVINNSRARLQNIKINNSGSAIGANNNSYVFAHQTSGTNNAVGLHADGAIINVIKNDIVATTPYVRMAGGVIHAENGDQAYPSNFTPRKFIGDYTNVDELRARLMSEMQALGVGESIACYFGNNLADGFGIYSANQRMQVDITKSTDYGNCYGTCIFRSHHDSTPLGFMRVQDGSFVDAFPVAIGGEIEYAISIGGATKKTPAVVVESYRSGTEWYRVWSDGWVEQGGHTSGSGYNSKTLTFLKPFADTTYTITFNGSNATKTSDGTNYFNNKTATTISIAVHADGLWYACGVGA